MSNQIVISSGAKVRELEGVLTGTSGIVNALGINVPSGIPQLDGSGKILVSQLPNSVMEYKGTWNAATNTPTLANGTGNQGDVYLVSVAGTTNFGAGPITFAVGDQTIYSGTIWQKAGGSTGTVTSVSVTETGDALSITGSPITTSGTINIGFNGTSGQYVNGAGGLTTFPSLTDYVTLSTTQTITAIKDFEAIQRFNLGLSVKSLTGNFTTINGSDNGLFIGVNSRTHELLFPNSSNFSYIFPATSGTLALTSQLTSGTVTSVGLSSATSGVTIGSSPITTSGTITLAIATASGSQNGLLSSTDWTTFNNKASTASLANYLLLTGGSLSGQLSILRGSGTGLDIASDSVIFRGNTGIGSPRQLVFSSGGGPTTLIEAKGYGASYNTDLSLKTYNSSGTGFDVFFATSAGNVGIGNTVPSSKLEVSGDLTISSSQPNSIVNFTDATSFGRIYFSESSTFKAAIQFMGSSFVSTSRRNALEIVNGTTGDLAMGSGDARTFYIKNGGNVGIGTSSPSSPLHVGTATSGNQKLQHWGEPGFVDNYGLILRGSSLDGVFKFYGLNNGTETTNAILSMNRSNGNVGIGTGSPARTLSVVGGDAASTGRITLTHGTSGASLELYVGISDGTGILSNNNPLWFYTNGSERMRITTDNNVLFNTTSTSPTNSSSFIFRSGSGSFSGVMQINHATTNNTGAGFLDCFYNTNYIGGIQQLGGSNVLFSTSSDYRLKEDLKDFKGLDLINRLNVYDFKWKTDETRMYGVIAHELQDVIPYAVSGNKDEVKSNGKIRVQVVDYSKLVPVLIKAIQELKAEIDELKNK